MSAFQVPTDHIDALLRAAQTYGRRGGGEFGYFWQGRTYELVSPEQFDQTGRMLWQENAHSVKTRYPEERKGLPGAVSEEMIPELVGDFSFDPMSQRTPTAVETLKICASYRYQACESRGWSKTRAAAFIEHLERAVIVELPGYEAAPWEWDASAAGSTPTARILALSEDAYLALEDLVHDAEAGVLRRRVASRQVLGQLKEQVSYARRFL